MGAAGDGGFAAVSAVCSALSALTVPYWIAGGWAIDLAAGRVTRDHADVDVMVLERDRDALWNDLQMASVHIARRVTQARHLTLHSDDLPLPVDVFLAEADGVFWVHRRGAYRVTRPLADITRHRDGFPFLAPEVVLLFKARSTADKDRHDVETALPLLDAGQRSWLQSSLMLLPRGQTAAVPHELACRSLDRVQGAERGGELAVVDDC